VFDLAVIVLRWVQMTGAMILFGSSLFFLYALPRSGAGSAASLRWPRPVLIASAVLALGACALGLLAQTAVLAGSLQDALTPESLGAVTDMNFGRSGLARAAAAAVLLIGLPLVRPGRGAWAFAAIGGGVICASFAWTGHGAATAGGAHLLHLSSDIVHTLAAGVWIGALVAFLILLLTDRPQDADGRRSLHAALHGFSGVGSALVAVLVATGLVNSWFVVGLAGLPRLLTTLYGQLLLLKLVLFGVMVLLAAANRFRLTPRLGEALAAYSQAGGAVAALRRSLAWETGFSLAVLALVAWFGMLAPPSTP
jgi:putative copper resistance protein D